MLERSPPFGDRSIFHLSLPNFFPYFGKCICRDIEATSYRHISDRQEVKSFVSTRFRDVATGGGGVCRGVTSPPPNNFKLKKLVRIGKF